MNVLKPWEYLNLDQSEEYIDNYEESWATVVVEDLSFEVFFDEEVSDFPCVCLGVIDDPRWDQSMPDSVLEKYLNAEIVELQEAMWEVLEDLSVDEIRAQLNEAGLTETNGLNSYV